jgi:GTP-binding protein
VTRDDHRIVRKVCGAGCALIVLLNKSDLVPPRRLAHAAAAVHRALPEAAFAPVVAVSAKTGFQVPRVLTTLIRVARTLRAGLREEECRTLLTQAWAAHRPPRFRGRVVSLKAARWRPGRPARLELRTAPVGQLPTPYGHYLLKRLHAHPALAGVPVQLVVTGPAPSR